MADELNRALFLGGLGGTALLSACAGVDGTPPPMLSGAKLLGGEPVAPADAIQSIIEKNFRGLVSESGAKGKGRGFVVGVTQAGRHYYFPFGELSYHVGGKPVTKYADALFFVGSNTKVFTGIMLALAVLSKKVTLETPIADLMPSGLTIQQPFGSILLKHLATHSSGYPDGPCGYPFTDYPFSGLTDFLQTFTPLYTPGKYWLYSNTAFGLLGVLVSNVLSGGDRGKLGSDGSWPPGYHTFWQQVVEQMCQPLNLTSTQVDYAGLRFLAVEGNELGSQGGWVGVAPPLFAVKTAGIPAGALSSTPSAMLNFLDAHLGLAKNQLLSHAVAIALTPQSPHNYLRMGLGWQIGGSLKTVYYAKNGGLNGYTSYMAIDPIRHWGISVLSNTFGNNFGNNLDFAGRTALAQLRGVSVPTQFGFPYPPSSLTPECP